MMNDNPKQKWQIVNTTILLQMNWWKNQFHHRNQVIHDNLHEKQKRKMQKTAQQDNKLENEMWMRNTEITN